MDIILQRVLDSIYEAVRKTTVSLGYAADKAQFPETTQGIIDYNTALDAIVSAKGFYVEIFNHGSSDQRYVKCVPRLVLNLRYIEPGNIGGDVGRYYSPNTGDPLEFDFYFEDIQPGQTSSFFVDIISVSSTAKQDYALSNILATAIPKMGHIPLYDNSTSFFFIKQEGTWPSFDFSKGLIERTYLYQMPDIFEIPDIRTNEHIKKITEIDTEVKVKGNGNEDTHNFIVK